VTRMSGHEALRVKQRLGHDQFHDRGRGSCSPTDPKTVIQIQFTSMDEE